MKRLKSNCSVVNLFIFIPLLLMYSVAYNNQIRSNQMLWFGTVGIAGAVMVLAIMFRSKIRITFMIKWIIVTYGYFFMSLLWADVAVFANPLKSLIIIFGITSLMNFLIDDIRDVKKIALANYIALVLTAVYIILMVDMSQVGEQRLGYSMETAWNSNDMSMKMCVGIALSFYFLGQSDNFIKRLFCMASAGLFVLIIFYCGSRSGLLTFMAICVFYLLIKAKGAKVLLAIVGSVAIVVLIYILLMNYEPLYKVLGSRIEEMIEGLTGRSEEGSFNWRELMIKEGWRYFKQKPILGHGVDNFQYVFGRDHGWIVYSHNNFIEMLVNGGIVGFAIYYSIFFYVLKGLWKPAIKNKEPLAMCIFIINLAKLICHFSTIPYYNIDTYMILTMGVLYITYGNRKGYIK